MGYGVIGSPTGSGPVSLGSSPGTPAFLWHECLMRRSCHIFLCQASRGVLIASNNVSDLTARLSAPVRGSSPARPRLVPGSSPARPRLVRGSLEPVRGSLAPVRARARVVRARAGSAAATSQSAADICRITVTSPRPVFHPMAPLGGKESTQRCHWGETRLATDALGAPRGDLSRGDRWRGCGSCWLHSSRGGIV
jgi:hypothetical protein